MADNYRKSSHPGRLFQIKKKTGTLIPGTRVIEGGVGRGGGGAYLIFPKLKQEIARCNLEEKKHVTCIVKMSITNDCTKTLDERD